MSYTTNYKFKKDGSNYSDLGLAFCDLANNQTIGGTKTFSNAPVVGTLGSDNNSTSAASTAFVKGQGYATTDSLSSYATKTSLGSYAALSGAVFTGALTMYGAGIEIYDGANAYIDFKNDPAADKHARIILYNSGDLNIEASKSITLGQQTYCNKTYHVQNNNYGIYWDVGGGGWYMNDTSWMLVYNDKAIYTGGTIKSGWSHEINGIGEIRNFTGNTMYYNAFSGVSHLFDGGSVRMVKAASVSIGGYAYLNSAGSVRTSDSATANYTLSVENGRIKVDSEIDVLSDKRIKTDIKSIDTSFALDCIRKLNPVNYTHIELNCYEAGFIAQEVESIIPESVNQVEHILPDIKSYGNVTEIDASLNIFKIILDGEIDISLMVPPTGLRCKKSPDDPLENHKCHIVEIKDNRTFIVEGDISDVLVDGRVYIYGTFVDDFRVLAKNCVFTYACAAVKQVDIEVQELKKENVLLRSEIQTINAELNELKELVKSLHR
jgi:hypothetical protein